MSTLLKIIIICVLGTLLEVSGKPFGTKGGYQPQISKVKEDEFGSGYGEVEGSSFEGNGAGQYGRVGGQVSPYKGGVTQEEKPFNKGLFNEIPASPQISKTDRNGGAPEAEKEFDIPNDVIPKEEKKPIIPEHNIPKDTIPKVDTDLIPNIPNGDKDHQIPSDVFPKDWKHSYPKDEKDYQTPSHLIPEDGRKDETPLYGRNPNFWDNGYYFDRSDEGSSEEIKGFFRKIGNAFGFGH